MSARTRPPGSVWWRVTKDRRLPALFAPWRVTRYEGTIQMPSYHFPSWEEACSWALDVADGYRRVALEQEQRRAQSPIPRLEDLETGARCGWDWGLCAGCPSCDGDRGPATAMLRSLGFLDPATIADPEPVRPPTLGDLLRIADAFELRNVPPLVPRRVECCPQWPDCPHPDRWSEG